MLVLHFQYPVDLLDFGYFLLTAEEGYFVVPFVTLATKEETSRGVAMRVF